MKIDLIDTNKAKVGEVELLPSVFEAKVKAHLIHDMVVNQLANRRAGTHSTKVRSEVRGGGAKPWRQKGLGRARAGSLRSPIFRGGGITFGPKPRDYSYKIPKKARRGALISALSSAVQDNALLVVDKIEVDAPSTKKAATALSTLGLTGKVLIVIAETDKNIELSFRNIPQVRLLLAQGINVYDVVNADNVVMTKEALDKIQERLGQ